MASQTLALSSTDLLAEYVAESRLKSFFEKRLAAPPDHMAMLIRNGEVINTYKGAHFSVGGLVKKFKELFVGSSHVSILLADLKPFSLSTDFNAITKDHVPVQAVATFELQVNPDKPANVMGLVNTGRRSSGEKVDRYQPQLTYNEVLERFKPHLTDRVVEAIVKRHDADELRGSRGLQDNIQADVMKEVERVAGDLGLIVRAVSVEWALNEVEREQMQKAILDREQERLDQSLEYLQRNLQRQTDATVFQIQSDLDVTRVQNASDEEIEHMILNREIRLTDAKVDKQRRMELEALAHEIEVLREERFGRFENQLAEADQAVDLQRRKTALAKSKVETNRIIQLHKSEMKKLEAKTRQDIERGDWAVEKEKLGDMHKMHQSELDADHRRRSERNQQEADIENERTRVEAQAEIDKMTAASILSPEQQLAYNAGFSEAAAQVLIEQARANASSNEEVMTLMRKMIADGEADKVATRDHDREMMRMAMEGASGVAHGAGGNSQVGPGYAGPGSSVIECPKCRTKNDVKNNFCLSCSHQFRT